MKKVLLRLPLYLLAAYGLWCLGVEASWRIEMAMLPEYDVRDRVEKVIEESVELNSLQLRDGLLYQSDEPEPFTGLVKMTGSGTVFLGRAWQGAVVSRWDRVVEGDEFSVSPFDVLLSGYLDPKFSDLFPGGELLKYPNLAAGSEERPLRIIDATPPYSLFAASGLLISEKP